MASFTAIELGADTCAIARTSVRRREVTLSAAEVLNPTSFPGADAFAAALRKTRRTLSLPRRARVVLWGLPDGANRHDPAAASALAPLIAAGFKIERVVTPCNALGALSRVHFVRGEDAICWVAINTAGVAIVAIRPGQQIYAHSFPWDSNVGATGSQARLLQRYSLVAFLAPEVTRALAAARAIGTPVRALITCGNLPDLRALTMPLIEELDLEVETLDSLDGLHVKPAVAERLRELAASIRLACAGAIARGTRPWDDSKRVAAHRTAALIRAAAVVRALALLGGAYMAYRYWAESREAAVTAPQASPVATSGVAPAPEAAPTEAAPAPSVTGMTAPTAPAASTAPAVGPAMLTDRLPRVTAILVSNDRRFATIDDGRVVGIGDTIGRRTVVGIDERMVTLSEPSGARIRIGLDGRRPRR